MNNFNKENFPNEEFDEEINLSHLFATLIRNKKPIITISLTSSIIAAFTVFNKPTIWEGSFNILTKNNQEKTSNYNSMNGFARGLNLLSGDSDDDNETQRLILSSPLVLMPVYEFFQEYNDGNKISFKKWMKSYLDIAFEKNSTILLVKYRGKDKNLILETLNLISEKYKDYSKKQTEKNITKTIKYLTNQTTIMQKKALTSQKIFNQFSIDNGLGSLDGFVGLGLSNNPLGNNNLQTALGNLTNNGGIDIGQIIQPKNLADQTEDSPGQRFNNQFKLLERYEAEYVDLSSKLKPESKVLNQLKNKIDNLRSALKRPNEILVKYKELKDSASRDQNILRDLVNNLEIFKLQKVKTPEAWELISKPTIDDVPVGPRRLRITLLSFIIPFIFVYLLTIIKEKNKGIIYETSILKKNIPYKLIETIFTNKIDLISAILNKEVKNKSYGVAIIEISDKFFSDEIKNSNLFSKEILNFEFITLSKEKKLNEFKNIILVGQKGQITLKNLRLLNNYLAIHKDKILGWFLIDTDL